jgi:hypothetical protein
MKKYMLEVEQFDKEMAAFLLSFLKRPQLTLHPMESELMLKAMMSLEDLVSDTDSET